MGENYGSQDRIKRLCDRTGCSSTEAELALAQGSLLEAVAYLEKQGQISMESSLSVNLGHFSTLDIPETVEKEETTVKVEHGSRGTVLDWLKRELILNQFQLWRGKKFLCGIPVILLLVLFPLTFGSLLPILTLPLLVGIHYRFSYQGSFLAEFNPIMKRVTNTLTLLRKNLFQKEKNKADSD